MGFLDDKCIGMHGLRGFRPGHGQDEIKVAIAGSSWPATLTLTFATCKARTAAFNQNNNKKMTTPTSILENSGREDESPREDQPLLPPQTQEAEWKPPRGFAWIQIALMNNVFLNAFDGTIMAATYAVISSEFGAANSASWLTTSYLISSTAVQPLYGRISDILGRRICFFVATVLFAVGSLGCGVSRSMGGLILMRALTGIGGGGLHIMATIVNSDLIPFRRRGIYQAMQNGIFGLGAICGASLGGNIADTIGWRWCFLLQVPVSLFALAVGSLVVKDQSSDLLLSLDQGLQVMWKRIDFAGALLLVLAVSVQLLGLGLGGNLLPWTSPWVLGSLVGSIVLFALFVLVEGTTSAIPMIPLRMLKGRLPVATQISNACAGCAAYGVRRPTSTLAVPR
jgi:MFS family permease